MPNARLSLESNPTRFAGGVKERRNYCVFADILRDVLFGVVRAHLFLVDVFFKDVAEDIGVNLGVVSQGLLIKVPLVRFKEVEKLLKCSVSNLNRTPLPPLTGGDSVELFNLMPLKDATVQVRHFSEQPLRFRVPLRFWFRKSLKEEGAKEIGVVSISTVALALSEFGSQIVRVIIQEAFLLDEVDKHQTVQHHRGVPPFHLLIRNSFKEIEKLVMFRFETVVKSFGDAFHVKGRPNTPGYVHQCDVFFLV